MLVIDISQTLTNTQVANRLELAQDRRHRLVHVPDSPADDIRSRIDLPSNLP